MNAMRDSDNRYLDLCSMTTVRNYELCVRFSIMFHSSQEKDDFTPILRHSGIRRITFSTAEHKTNFSHKNGDRAIYLELDCYS